MAILGSEVSYAQAEQQKVSEMERMIKEQKLKMLIKFEQIKLFEDFYNVRSFH